MTSNWLERNKTLNRCGMYSIKKSIWENQYLSLIMYTWVCTQRQCERSKDFADNYRTMFESWISAGATEKLPISENLCISSWSYDMAGHAKKCVERYCELAKKDDSTTLQSIYSTHWWPPLQRGRNEICWSQIVLKCQYLARIGRPDILWSVNKLARSITKWTKACDKRLNRLISYIHHTCEYKQFVMWVILQNNAGWSDFAGDLEDTKSTSGGTLCVSVQQNPKSSPWTQNWD